MRFSSALIPFLSSLLTTSVAMAMEEPHDSVLHDVTASILEESIEVKYKNKKSYLEPMKIQNSIDGHPNKANDVELADDKGDIMQKKELIHHLVDHQEHQEGKSLEECNISSTTTTAAAAAAATATATATSDDDSLMKRKISLDKEGIKKMDYGHLNRGTCSSPNDACVPQNKAIEANFAFFEPEDASYASSGYCVPLSVLEDIEYKNAVTTTMSLIDNEEFNKEEEMTNSYYHYHPQYDQHHRQLDSLDCASECPGTRPDVSSYDGPFYYLTNCYVYGDCKTDYPDISCWNTAGITDMYFAFYGDYSGDYYSGYSGGNFNNFNDPIECWDVGQVTSMYFMFLTTYSFNQPIDTWDVSKVEDMKGMFVRATSFNQSIDTWNVSQVKYMEGMFSSATYFNQPIDSWDVSQVTTMGSLFSSAVLFNRPIDSWNVSQVETMRSMFFNANNFNQSIDTWDVSQVETMRSMFSGASSFNQSIDSWDVSQVTNMESLFFAATSFNRPIDLWNVSKVEYMNGMFGNAKAFNQPIDSWNVSQVKSMRTMFDKASSFNQPIDSWDVSKVENMSNMFSDYDANSFNQPIDSWNVSQVSTMRFMFSNAYNFNQSIDSWDVSQVQYMDRMFFDAFAFNQCLSTWAEKTTDTVYTSDMLNGTDCPNRIDSPNATIGPWCQDNTQGCFAPGFGTPTGAPTVTKNPYECNNVDESDFDFKGKSCKKYLKKKTGKKCKKKIDGVLVADSCPSLCKRFCPPCKNKSGKIKLENGKRFNCKKIKKKKKCNSITKSGALAKEICPVACYFEGC